MADSNKSEQATPRQRQKARERGQVTRSRELTARCRCAPLPEPCILMCQDSRAAVGALLPHLAGSRQHADSIEPGGRFCSGPAWRLCAGSFRFLARHLRCRWLRVGAGRIRLCARGVGIQVRAAQSLQTVKQTVLARRPSARFSSRCCRSPQLPGSAVASIAHMGTDSRPARLSTCAGSCTDRRHIFGALLEVRVDSACWAGVDFMLLWWKNEGDLKMSRQDIKDEMKQSKAIRRARPESAECSGRAGAGRCSRPRRPPRWSSQTRRTMRSRLRYEMDMKAPIVVAKGLDEPAAKIKEIAWRLDIPVMENRPLAQALYKDA
jgi:flagellar biosynthetic protein FlhB